MEKVSEAINEEVQKIIKSAKEESRTYGEALSVLHQKGWDRPINHHYDYVLREAHKVLEREMRSIKL